jgi:hypothetical protein
MHPLTAGLVYGGLLCKLAIQPVHVALFMFYRGLSLLAVCVYVLTYYSVGIYFFFCYFSLIVQHLGLAWAGVGLLALGGGLTGVLYLTTTGLTLRQVLMFSTLYNLSLILAVAC